jgi:hypothetical protein
MLKKLPEDEGPHELRLNRLFSSEPLASNPRNHCAPLLDVIELPNDSPIMVHSQLRKHYKPPFHTYGEFVTFFGQICNVCCWLSPWASVELLNCLGNMLHARESRRSSVSASFYDSIQVHDLVCQGLHFRKHHARPITNVSKVIPSHGNRSY